MMMSLYCVSEIAPEVSMQTTFRPGPVLAV